jgi:hypothetical protein
MAALFLTYYLQTKALNENINWSLVCLVKNNNYTLLVEPAFLNIFLDELEEP